MDSIAERIQHRMRKKGWEDADGKPNANRLAEAMGMSYSTVNQLVRGKTKHPEAETIRRAARALGVTADWLLGEGNFDRRAYEKGRERVASAVEEALRDAMESDPVTGELETEPFQEGATGDEASG